MVRYVDEAPFTSIDQAISVLHSAPLRDYRLHGFGRLACIEKSSGDLIGFCGLKYLPDLDEVDIGYRFLPAYWGKGLATESCHAVIQYGREVLKLERIIGLVDPKNEGSVKVLCKLGLQYERTISPGPTGIELDLYA